MARGDKPTTTALALKDGWTYEDALPTTITKEQYDWWHKESLVLDGVRMGPPLADQPPDRAWVKLLSGGELSAYRTDIRVEHRDGRPIYEYARVRDSAVAVDNSEHPYFVHVRNCAKCGAEGLCSEGRDLYNSVAASTAPPGTAQ